MKAVLLRDIVSSLSAKGKKTMYGSRNEVVKVLHERGEVWIVEGRAGTFSAKKHDLQKI